MNEQVNEHLNELVNEQGLVQKQKQKQEQFSSAELLQQFGWNAGWEASFSAASAALPKGCMPARVIAQFTNQYRIMTTAGELSAEVSGKFQFQANTRSEYPAVGDWVAAAPMDGEKRAIIHSVLPRRSAMIRRASGSVPEEQVIGTNIDTLFIVGALNGDYNVSRIERYLVTAWESGATPVVLLTKADLCDNIELSIAEVEASAPGVPVHAVSAVTGIGREALAPYLQPGSTIAVTGSSGVGKSTLLNWLAGGELQRVQGIREDDARGRHTTTHRELFPLPGGFIMMDTPGMRELQLWESDGGWQEAFADIEAIAANCRFRDCHHERELGCAVREALQSGALEERRFTSYKKTGRELAHQMRKEQSVSKRQQKSADKRREARTSFSKLMINAD
ncbi:ribosome small subunit-dependent GTPase A [Paenibacillus sp. OV219]|uniref:ribosome small subunit-dependent GTPase A n=1 Tax=Paenibacillus sp. OV219 TaxID=1884377 RepID=UPI0008D015F8|nr:ribosome small subunit-dependent GTPase A [Paenibacillus sp. OV219]SEO19509.1 ribosome biogenesis GTPase [Paenibacillus sp. OV219]